MNDEKTVQEIKNELIEKLNCEKCNEKIDEKRQCPGQLIRLCFECWEKGLKPGTAAHTAASNWKSHFKG